MNQNLCRSLTAVVLVYTMGIPLSASAESTPNLESSLPSQVNPEVAAEPPEVLANDGTASQPTPVPNLQARDLVDRTEIFRVSPHLVNDRQVAILSIHGLPVLTFFGSSAEASASKAGAPDTSSDNPVIRAEAVVQQLEAFQQAAGDPTTILARWDSETEQYVIELKDESLVVINEATVLHGSTGNPSEDTLQAANRLRSLLGPVSPLAEVEGEPEPEVAAADSWRIANTYTGQASWYGPGFHGRRTASGEVFNQNALTAAHRTLPFGTLVRVTNLHNNRQVVVRINDRGPFSHGRILDLSAGAAREIGLDRAGVGPIRLEVLASNL